MTMHGLLSLPPALLAASEGCCPSLYSPVLKPSIPLSLQRSPTTCWYSGMEYRTMQKKSGREVTGEEDPHSPHSRYRGDDGAKVSYGLKKKLRSPFLYLSSPIQKEYPPLL